MAYLSPEIADLQAQQAYVELLNSLRDEQCTILLQWVLRHQSLLTEKQVYYGKTESAKILWHFRLICIAVADHHLKRLQYIFREAPRGKSRWAVFRDHPEHILGAVTSSKTCWKFLLYRRLWRSCTAGHGILTPWPYQTVWPQSMVHRPPGVCWTLRVYLLTTCRFQKGCRHGIVTRSHDIAVPILLLVLV